VLSFNLFAPLILTYLLARAIVITDNVSVRQLDALGPPAIAYSWTKEKMAVPKIVKVAMYPPLRLLETCRLLQLHMQARLFPHQH
jgi:hypothetical protein